MTCQPAYYYSVFCRRRGFASAVINDTFSAGAVRFSWSTWRMRSDAADPEISCRSWMNLRTKVSKGIPHWMIVPGVSMVRNVSFPPYPTQVYFLSFNSTVCGKNIPISCLPFSKQPLGIFMWNFTRLLLVHIHIKMPSGIWLPSITAKLHIFVCDHLVIFAHSKISVRKRLHWNKEMSNIVELMTPEWCKLRKQ